MFISIANSIGARLQTYISQLISSLIQRHDSYENIGCTEATLAGLDKVSSNGDTLLRRASFVFTPTAYDAGDLGAIIPDDGSGDLTFVRTGGNTASRINKEGLIEFVPMQTPRINYDGDCGALLLEPFTINELTYSEDFSQWTPTNVTVTGSFITSPDGELTGSKLDFDGTTNANILLSTTATGTTTFSVYLRVPSGTQSVTIGVSSTDNSSVTVTDEWVRYEHTGTGAVGYISCDDDVDVYVWGAQLEEKSFKTSYIKTNGAAVQRSNESSFKRDAESLINSPEGVLYVEMKALANTGGNRNVQLDDTTNNNVVTIGFSATDNTIRAEVKVGGVSPFFQEVAVTEITSFKKYALKWKVNDFALWIDGVEVATDLNGVSFAADVLNDIEFESAASSFFNGEIKSVAIFEEALTDDDLQKLTS